MENVKLHVKDPDNYDSYCLRFDPDYNRYKYQEKRNRYTCRICHQQFTNVDRHYNSIICKEWQYYKNKLVN